MRAELAQYEIWARWPDLVGERIAAHTEPAGLKNRRLTVRVASAAWLQELSFLRAELVQKINAGLGDERVREIRLVAGSKVHRKRPAAARSAAQAAEPIEQGVPEPLLAEAESSASAVQDEPLREAVRRAAIARVKYRPD
jgi:hypothetical protein